MSRKLIYLTVIMFCIGLLPVHISTAQDGAWSEMFDDPTLPGWDRSPGVFVVDGVLRIEPGNFAGRDGNWANFNLSASLRLTGSGPMVLTYQAEAGNPYILLLTAESIELLHESNGAMTQVGSAPYLLTFNEWHQVQLSIGGNTHVVTLDGEPVLTVSDPASLPQVRWFSFEALDQAIVEVDNLTINTGAEVSVQPETPPAQTTLPPAQGPVGDPGVWVRQGGPPGGLGYDIRMNPDNPDIMYVTDAHAGVHKSVDGGQTWFPANQGILPSATGHVPIFSLTIDPHDHNAVWAGTQNGGHVYYSADAGQTWQARDAGIFFEGRSVRGITVDPNNPNVVYAATEVSEFVWLETEGYEQFPGRQGRVKGEVYKSTDQGQSWIRIWYGDNLARYVWVDPRNSDRVYVSTGIFDRDAANGRVLEGDWGGVGLLRSDDGGQTWTVFNEQHGLGGRYITSLFMHPTNPDVLLVSITGTAPQPGVFASYDGGTSWQMVLDTAGWGMEAVEIAESDTNVWYAAGEGRIWRSDDAGASWQEFALRTPDRSAGVPIDIQVDPRDAYRVFVNNYGGGNFLSEDGGATWVDASRGYTGSKVFSEIAVWPDDPNIVLVQSYRSTDGGQTWAGIDPSTTDFAFYRLDSGGIGILTTDGVGRAWHSIDGGISWTANWIVNLPAEVEAGRATKDIQSNVLAMAPADSQVVYVGYSEGACIEAQLNTCYVDTAGIYRSRDGGHSWEALSQAPFFGLSVMGLAVHPADSTHVFAATVNGLYESRDSGTSWQHQPGIVLDVSGITDPASPVLQLSAPVLYDVEFDPFDWNTLYVTSMPGGVWISRDGGQTWAQAMIGMDPNEPVYQILPDPNHAGLLYVSSGLSGVFYSTDGGARWQRVADGLTNLNVRSLALSQDGSVLYAGTLGSGVFRLDTSPFLAR